MLLVRTNYYREALTSQHRNINRIEEGSTEFLGSYVRSEDIRDIVLPVLMNGFNFKSKTYVWHEDEELDFNEIINSLNNTDTTTINYIKLLTEDVNITLDPDEWISYDEDAIGTLYRTAIEKLKAREALDNINIKVWKHKIKHTVLVATNYNDDNQLTEFFLTLGLLPKFFPDFEEKLSDIEKKFFEVLVKRSQVKRIVNSDAITAFEEVDEQEKYKEVYRSIRLESAIRAAVYNRATQVQYKLNDITRETESLLRQYTMKVDDYNKNQKILENIQGNEEQTLADLKAALTIQGVVNYNYNGSILEILIKTPLDLYDPEEAELALSRYNNKIVQVFRAVFVKQDYKMYALTNFYLNLSAPGFFEIPRTASDRQWQANGGLYNPHYYLYNCLGDYKAHLAKAHGDMDYILYLSTAVTANRNVNFRDGAVIRSWIDKMENLFIQGEKWILDIKCLEDKNGETFSIQEVYDLIQATPEEEEDL